MLRPSLPPVISSTTKMVSLPGAAACAVRDTNCGTTEFQRHQRRALQGMCQKLPTIKPKFQGRLAGFPLAANGLC